jgi:hypothetical protein
MKKTKHFYGDIVSVDEIIVDLDAMDLTGDQKKELVQLAHMNLHTAIVDAVLSELAEGDKKIFLELLARDEHEKIWNHLNEKVEKIEDKITDAGEQVKKELREDIKKVRKN